MSIRIGSIALLFGVMLSAPARAEIWCIRDFGSAAPKACVFPTLRDCVTGAVIAGGACVRADDLAKTEPGRAMRRRAARSAAAATR